MDEIIIRIAVNGESIITVIAALAGAITAFQEIRHVKNHGTPLSAWRKQKDGSGSSNSQGTN